MANPQDGSDSDGPIINDNVIRIQLRKPQHRKWELRTRNHSPGINFPIIQLFDCDGNILLETNDENVSIRSSDYNEPELKTSHSLNEKDYRHIIHPNGIKKSNTVAGQIYTRLFSPKRDQKLSNLIVKNLRVILPSRQNSDESIIPSSDVWSEKDYSSYKSSDNESSAQDARHKFVTSRAGTLLISPEKNVHSPFRRRRTEEDEIPEPQVIEKNCTAYVRPSRSRLQRQQSIDDHDDRKQALHKSKSFHSPPREQPVRTLARRSKTDVLPSSKPTFAPPANKVSFLDTYLRSLPNRAKSNPGWLEQSTPTESPKEDSECKQTAISDRAKEERVTFSGCERPQPDQRKRYGQFWDEKADSDVVNLSSDAAAAATELSRRLRLYRRGASEVESADKGETRTRRRSEGDYGQSESSSESPDEADAVLNRLRRRILKNKCRAKRTLSGNLEQRTNQIYQKRSPPGPLIEQSSVASSVPEEPVEPHAPIEECLRPTNKGSMGSNISHHSVKGLTGRRARSSGDLCNGDTKSQTESSVYGSVVGEVMGWNRSLPNHLDGNRHLASEYNGSLPRGNNNYGEGCRYHPKGVRAWRYRASKAAGSEAEPVWKLQDPGCDQGYGSERSPEEDYPPAARHTTYEEYEAQLRLMYPFITVDNTFTVVVEKDGRGLGMSVSGGDEGGGLVRIRRLYPPQPAWRTGRLAPRDLLLAANGVPLTGLTTYEALEVLRTTAPRVELRVCRPPADVLDCLTPPAPPTPPTRHTPCPPPDPLNCHPLHTRLSATTSSATTSSSEGRYGACSASGMRRDDAPSPDPQGGYDRPDSLRLPDLEQPLPVYDVQYGEFDIIMTKVNGSLGFTLRKEDHSALGHYVRALVREPALSDGRIQPGDRIVAVNEVSMSGMSHADAVAFLRSCGAEVRLRLYRDHAATPLSPLSPQESHERHSPSDSDTATVKPKPHLRQEAVNMLCDLAARRLTPDAAAADGSRSPCLSPRKYRRLTRDSTGQSQGSDNEPYTVVCPTSTDTNSDSEPGPPARAPRPQHLPCRPLRPHSLNLGGPPTPLNCRKQKLTLTVAPHGYELNNLDNDVLDAPNIYQDGRGQPVGSHYLSTGNFQGDISTEPISMPVGMPSVENQHFAHKNPAYQSAVVHPSSNDNTSGNDSHKDDGNGMKKWKGVTLSPDKERKAKPEVKPKTIDPVQKENLKPEEANQISKEPTILTVEMNRGWNSRLGFSIQSHPDSGQSYVSAIYSDSVAARDGRLRKGDIILQVNDENVTSMKTSEVIDLMRILRGSICITVLRPCTQ